MADVFEIYHDQRMSLIEAPFIKKSMRGKLQGRWLVLWTEQLLQKRFCWLFVRLSAAHANIDPA
jgi:hypothetical protein